MLKKTITFDSIDGTEQFTEDFWFHLSKAELAELAMTTDDGFDKMIKNISMASARQDKVTMIREFKRIILMSVGKLKADGKSFVKSDEIRAEFEGSNAFGELFIELATNENAAAEFIQGLVPANLDRDVTASLQTAELPEDTRPAWIREDREPTRQELNGMTQDQLREAFLRKQQKS